MRPAALRPARLNPDHASPHRSRDEASPSLNAALAALPNPPSRSVLKMTINTLFRSGAQGPRDLLRKACLLAAMGTATALAPASAFADDATDEPAADSQQEPAPARRVVLDPVYIIGDRPGDLAGVPGSGAVVTQEDIALSAPYTASEVLRAVPGIHILEEEGMGLRPNIGFRGLDPDRSRSILVMEDGVPIALMPYAEPELYYAPPIERMQGVEILKGSGSILYGPQTVGGVLNYRTLDPPDAFRTTLDLRLGTFGYRMLHATMGATHGQVGYLFHIMHGGYEGPRALDLTVNDVMSKFRLAVTDTSTLILKLNFYDEVSAATYWGLTQSQYEANPRLSLASNDQLPVRRYAASLSHQWLLGDSALLETTAYATRTTRNWRRQDYENTPAEGRTYERVYDGQGTLLTGDAVADAPTDGSGTFFRDSTGNRNRSFEFAGVESRLLLDWQTGTVGHETTLGSRFHYEFGEERRIDGQFATSRTGVIREDETRHGHNLALYGLHRAAFFDRLRVSAGLRMESMWSERTRYRQRVDGTPTDLREEPTAREHLLVLIPGAGLSYDLTEGMTLFAGAHRGFAPPRTKDNIRVSADGQTAESLDLDAEYSINYELGFRYRLANYLGLEVAGFVLDFSNQAIPPTASSGQQQAGAALVNAGSTFHAGVESAVTFDAALMADAGFRLPLSLSYTYVHAEFGDDWAEEIAGNRLPYAPEHMLSARLGFIHPLGISAQVTGTYRSEQFADRLETREPSPNGRVGQIDSVFLLDARLAYTYQPLGLGLYVGGKNLLDNSYIASRRPEGIQPGNPREIYVGLRGEF